ncbi:MAG: hypothetical protein ABJ013_10225 [Halioglobus sp.]
MKKIVRCTLFICLYICSKSVVAAVIFSQAPPSTTGGFVSDFASNFTNQQASAFQIASDDSVLSMVVWGRYTQATLPADNFTVRFFSDNAGSPQSSPFAEQAVTPISRTATQLTDPSGATIYQYVIDLPAPVALTGSTRYYFSIVNSTSEADKWSWTKFVGGPDERWNRAGDISSTGSWTDQDEDLAFELFNSAIEPLEGVKSFAPKTISAGQTSQLILAFASESTLNADNVSLTDNLPAGMTVADPANIVNSCVGGTVTAVPGSNVVTYTGGTVLAGIANNCQVRVDVTSSTAGALVNTTGDVTSSLGNSGPFTDTLTVSPFPATIGGLLTGLVAGDTLILQNNAGDDLTLTADGAFTFVTPVDSGDPYAVTVLTQPVGPSETCTVSNGSGTTPAANVDTVTVTCSLNNYSAGGSISGITAGSTVVVQNNGADSRSISADGNFTFSPQADGTDYAITVSTQPADQTCTVTNGTGTLAGSDITSARITCVDNSTPPDNVSPKPVPVMSLWLQGLMLMLIAGIGSLGVRRRL